MADNSGPKKPKMNRNSPEYKEKLAARKERYKGYKQDKERKRQRYAIRQGFAERLLGSYGLGEEHFKENGFVKGKLGMFAEAMNSKTAGPDSVPPETPTQQSTTNPSNAKISNIIEVLHEILSICKKIGAVTTEQEEALRKKLSDAENSAKEASMERGNPSADAEKMAGGTDFSSINDSINSLNEKIKPLSEAVDEKVKEQEEDNPKGFMQRLAESYGVGDDYEEYTKNKARRKSAKAARAARIPEEELLDRNGNKLRGNALQARIRRINAAREASAASPTKLGKAVGAVKNVGKSILGHFGNAPGVLSRGIASRVGGATAAIRNSSVSKKIASLIGKGTRGAATAAEAAEHVGPGLIKRIAGPIIEKAIGKTALKSIPIIGTAIGGLFAAEKLVEGDPVGAGLEATSGLAGPLTAIPAMIASVARDAYSAVFNVAPEQDPNFVGRMAMITGVIGTMVTAMLASSIKKEDLPTKQDIDKATLPPKPAPAQQQTGQTPTGQLTIPPAARPEGGNGNNGGGGGGGGGNDGKPPKVPPRSNPSSSSESKSSSDASMKEKKTDDAADKVSSMPTSGADLMQKTAEVEQAGSQPMYPSFDKGRPLPATRPPIRNGVSGAGDVPDPHYYGCGADLLNQMGSSVVADSGWA